MKLILSSTITLAILSGATSTEIDTANNNLANCFRNCERKNGTGSAANSCRSGCRAGNTWSGRDYKNRRNPRKNSRSKRRRNDDWSWDKDAEEGVVDTLNEIMAFSMPNKDDDDDDVSLFSS
jgi:hypothetical protein